MTGRQSDERGSLERRSGRHNANVFYMHGKPTVDKPVTDMIGRYRCGTKPWQTEARLAGQSRPNQSRARPLAGLFNRRRHNEAMKVYTAKALKVTGSSFSKRRKTEALGWITADTREEAITKAFIAWPNANEVLSGYGHDGSFDMIWTKREDWRAGDNEHT